MPTTKYKICTVCKEEKEIILFSKCKRNKSGYSSMCKKCVNEKQKIKRYENIEKVREWGRENSKNQRINNKQKCQDLKNNSYRKNIEHYRKQRTEYENKKRNENIQHRIKSNLRSRMISALKNGKKLDTTINLLGCSVNELKKHLECKFDNNMTWNNYGRWHIDHIKPCALFDLTDLKQQQECFHYTNLQPLWAFDNISKGKKYKEAICQ